MQKTPVLKAKFTVPEIPPGALFCDRIRKLGIAEARAAIISAAAGYGKTTAVLLSLQHARGRIHWYRMEKEDAALPVFYAHLIESLFGSIGQDTDSHRSLSSIGNITEEHSLLGAVVCQDAWTLFADAAAGAGFAGAASSADFAGDAAGAGSAGDAGGAAGASGAGFAGAASGGLPRYLVFDDFHYAADNAAIRETVRYLISNLPPYVRLILISRTDPGISVEKLALSGELVFLDGTHLVFSEGEIAALYAGIEKPETRARQAKETFAYTEGWIAGIALMKHVMEDRETVNTRSFHDDRQNVFRYLVGEVFAGADREMLRRAAKISLLDEFVSDDLAAIFQMDGAEETIAWLERNNFYIQKTNTAPPSYRFHSLFRDALRQVLADELSREEILSFHRCAAGYFEKTSRFKAAIDHFLSGQDEESAVRLASARGTIYMDEGNVEAGAALIRALPERLIFAHAALLIVYGCSLGSTETQRSFSYLERAIGMAVKNKELAIAINAQGFAISLCIQQNDYQSIKGVIDMVPMAQALRVSKQARKMLIHSLFLKSATSFQVKLAKMLNRFIDKISMDDQVDLWQYSTLLSKAFLFGVIGDLREAEQIIIQLMEHPVAHRNDRWRAFGLQLSGYLAVFMGDGKLLQRAADELTSLGLKYASGFAAGNGAHYTALAKYIKRDQAGAIAAMGEAEKYFVDSQNHAMAVYDGILRIAWQAELEPDASFAGRMEEQLSSLASLSGNANYLTVMQSLTGALYLREGSLDKAEFLLMQAWKWAKSKQAPQNQCGVAMHLAALYREKGDSRREEEYLRFFGEVTAKHAYVYFREMSFVALVRVCARCVQLNISPQHMAAIIGKYFGPGAADSFLHEAAKTAADPEAFIRRFPTEARARIEGVEVKLFGAFSLTVDGKHITAAAFKTRKIISLFKYILANPGQILSREKLAASFWPDSDGKAAANSLRVALYELRKAMAALDMAFEGENALIAEDKSGFFVCHPAMVESDVSRFVALHNKLRMGKLLPDEEIAALQELTGLYDGDYLEGSDAEDSVVARVHYRSVYVEASHRLASHYRANGDTALAEALMLKHLRIDPFDERICSMLIEIYMQAGRSRQANSLKRQFMQYFEKEMGVSPEI